MKNTMIMSGRRSTTGPITCVGTSTNKRESSSKKKSILKIGTESWFLITVGILTDIIKLAAKVFVGAVLFYAIDAAIVSFAGNPESGLRATIPSLYVIVDLLLSWLEAICHFVVTIFGG